MKTKNLAVGILAAVLSLALWWSYMLKPMRAQASKVKADTETERSKLRPLQAQLDAARADVAHSSTLKAELASLRRTMPSSPALAAWIRDANGIAAGSGVTWQSITHGPPTLGGGGAVSSITLGILVKGSYEQVMEYVTQIAKLRRLVVIDSVQFTSSGTTGAGAGTATSSAAARTGPFTGASELSVTISARMFAELGGGTAASGSTAASAPAPGSGASPVAKPPALNNS